jgi:hypothetical protein
VGLFHGSDAHQSSIQWTFLWKYLKYLVYATSVQGEPELQQHVKQLQERHGFFNTNNKSSKTQ